jgi:hypothetical protein
VPLGRFIVDVLAPRARLVVEVDGGYHSTRAGADASSRAGVTASCDPELAHHDPTKAVAIIQAALQTE